MKAINLIPADQQRGAGGRAGRSGGAAYGLVGALAIALLIFGLWTQTTTKLDNKAKEADAVEQQAQIREAQASSLGAFTKFAALRTARVQTVKQLADSRFDWAHAFGELSRTIPAGTWLTAVTGTTAPGVGSGVASAGDGLRAAKAVPALELTGCSTSQAAVTTFITRLRLMNGVDDVTISKSVKGAPSTGTGSAGGVDSAAPGAKVIREDPCAGARPSFSVVVFYKGMIVPPGKTGAPTLGEAAGAQASGGQQTGGQQTGGQQTGGQQGTAQGGAQTTTDGAQQNGAQPQTQTTTTTATTQGGTQ